MHRPATRTATDDRYTVVGRGKSPARSASFTSWSILNGAPPMRQMFEAIGLVREQANPFLTILGVIPTMYDRRWPEHRAFLHQCTIAHTGMLFDVLQHLCVE